MRRSLLALFAVVSISCGAEEPVEPGCRLPDQDVELLLSGPNPPSGVFPIWYRVSAQDVVPPGDSEGWRTTFRGDVVDDAGAPLAPEAFSLQSPPELRPASLVGQTLWISDELAPCFPTELPAATGGAGPSDYGVTELRSQDGRLLLALERGGPARLGAEVSRPSWFVPELRSIVAVEDAPCDGGTGTGLRFELQDGESVTVVPRTTQELTLAGHAYLVHIDRLRTDGSCAGVYFWLAATDFLAPP